jgi:hypothetical protein
MPLTVVPVAGQNLVSSRDLIAGNFYAIGTMLNPATNMVTLPVTTTPATVALNTGNLYTKTVGGSVGLFWKPDTATTEIQLGPTGGGGGVNWTVLPGGYYMEWGTWATDGAGSRTVPLTKITAAVSATVTASGNIAIMLVGVNPASLSVSSWDPAHAPITAYPGVPFKWIAIGS